MNGIHDALDKAIQQAEQEKTGVSVKHNQHVSDAPLVTAQARQQLDAELMRQRRIVTLHGYNTEAEAYRMLRTKILKQLRDKNLNSFGITSPGQGEGKTNVAVNLAIAMAMDVNQSVLLVDLDLRYPKLHWHFGLDNEFGLRDYFLSEKSINEILINPGIERLTILPGRGQAVGSSEILSGPRMKALGNDINKRNRSQIVIFDLPPVLATDDVLATTDFYDAILVVVEEGKSQPEEIKQTLKLLANKHLLGTVLNKSRNIVDQQVH
jgi:protein-tyrosine kinase